MPRLTPVFVTVLALAVPSVLVAAPQAAAKGNKDVTVRVICRPNDEGPASVTVDPWLLELEEGEETTWKLHITRPKKNWIVVAPKDEASWPYLEGKHEGKDEAQAKGMKQDPQGSYRYNITIYCSDEETVIDPRVRVR